MFLGPFYCPKMMSEAEELWKRLNEGFKHLILNVELQ